MFNLFKNNQPIVAKKAITGTDLISDATNLFTDAQEKLEKGIELNTIEAQTITDKMDALNVELLKLEKSTTDATKLKDNITKLLND